MPDKTRHCLLFEFAGSYGGYRSHSELVRALREALALIECQPPDAQLLCPPFRIEKLMGCADEQDQPSD
jgi:hypothetical protein